MNKPSKTIMFSKSVELDTEIKLDELLKHVDAEFGCWYENVKPSEVSIQVKGSEDYEHLQISFERDILNTNYEQEMKEYELFVSREKAEKESYQKKVEAQKLSEQARKEYKASKVKERTRLRELASSILEKTITSLPESAMTSKETMINILADELVAKINNPVKEMPLPPHLRIKELTVEDRLTILEAKMKVT